MITITVTQNHIERSKVLLGSKIGFFHDRFQCPLTLAIRDAFKTDRVMSHTYTAEVDGTVYSISKEATEFCYRWSRGEECYPIEFKMEYMSGLVRAE